MRPRIQLLGPELIGRILREAFELLMNPGVRVGSAAVELLRSAGVDVEVANNHGVARIPERLVQQCLASAPHDFYLYNRQGEKAVHYGGDDVHFDPGSCCVQMLDPETLEARPSETRDLVRIVQVTETLPQFAAQSTAVVCNDALLSNDACNGKHAPGAIGDLYRLFVVLQYSDKPVVTGSFSAAGLEGMIDLLAADSGSPDNLRQQPRAVFDVCPSPPLNWSEFGSHNLIDLARAGVPAEIVSMPLAGGTAPVTLAGSVTQHAAEVLAGITLHQLAAPGAPIVWGGAPAIFDMRTGGAPMGAVETAMLNMACAEVGKHLGLPTHGYLVATDSKLVDAQAGAESARSATLGALAGINMISGAGMLESLACFSVEKLVIDAESIASAYRLARGIEVGSDEVRSDEVRGDRIRNDEARDQKAGDEKARGEKVPRETLATATFAQIGLTGEFLKLKETRALFRQEQHLPSPVIDRSARGSERATDVLTRVRTRVDELVGKYRKPSLSEDVLRKFQAIVDREAVRAGVEGIESGKNVGVAQATK
ncbi:MAG: trimethylamine methyltransferase family protein [Terriglobales bacterium]|jgi:trimethylamine--corrinoid protein Co-methyltransferase